MISITITPDILQLNRKLSSGLNTFEQELMQGIRDDVHAKAKQNATRGRPGLNRKSGALSSNIQTTLTGGRYFGDGAMISTGVNLDVVPYARIHELGGTIRPKRAKFLVFKTDSGHWVKTRQVRIPKRSYLEPAVQSVATTSSLKTRLDLTVTGLQSRGVLP